LCEAAPAGRSGTGGNGGGGNLGAGPGISVGNGTPFPFPWYIKAIYTKLDQKWRPPAEFGSGTQCVVSFVIARSGAISNVRMTKSSDDSLFDGLAERAVTAANPMPKLPDAYPEDTLDVHMTFIGK
jgi:TonB family protein